MTKEDYGMAPMRATAAVRFFIPSLGPDNGARLYAFAAQADLDATKRYYDELGKASAMLFSWTFVRANILLQINGNLPESQAKAYQVALQAIP